MACSHNSEWTCAVCEDAAHRALHPEFVEGCTACKLDRIHFGAGTGVTTGNAPPSRPDPAWERGVAGEHRADGSFMPYLNPDLSPIGVKQASEQRHEIEDAKRRLASDPAPVA